MQGVNASHVLFFRSDGGRRCPSAVSDGQFSFLICSSQVLDDGMVMMTSAAGGTKCRIDLGNNLGADGTKRLTALLLVARPPLLKGLKIRWL